MHTHEEQNQICFHVINQIASETNKSIHRIMKLLLAKRNQGVEKRFWELLEDIIPNHDYYFVDWCYGCQSMSLY